MRVACCLPLLLLALLVLPFSACSKQPPQRSQELATQGIYTGALSSNGEYSLIGSLNHGASLWRNSDHERLFNWHHRAGEFTDLVAAAFSADGQRAVTTDPRTLVLWDTASGSALAYWTTPASVLDVELLPDGHSVLMGMKDHSAVLFDADTGSHLQTLLHDGVVGSVAVSADGRRALTGSDDETARLWDLQSGTTEQIFQHDNPVRVVAISRNGKVAFSAAQNQDAVIWDADTGHALHTLTQRNQGITSARFSADADTLLLGYVNRRVELWDVRRGELVQNWNARSKKPWQSHGGAILAVGFGPGRAFYALAGDGQLVELSPG
jgi:WD40 repeat protein